MVDTLLAEEAAVASPPIGLLPTVEDPDALRARVTSWRRAGERIAFVPTMGALHAGHLALVEQARANADRVVVSIFVNPTQFNSSEDLERYPRTVEADAILLAEAGCDLLFLPGVSTLYPEGHSVVVEPGTAALGLEGEHRPGHFRGVVTVVTLLFNLVMPDVALFGRKDAQQLAVIEQLVRDLHLPVTIQPVATVREADGLALSSRNRFLSPDDRRAATVLHRALTAAQAEIATGERSADAVRARLLEVLAEEPRAQVEYAEVVDAESFRHVDIIRGPIVLPLAVVIGKTRLIDNLSLDPNSLEPNKQQASMTDKEIPCNA